MNSKLSASAIIFFLNIGINEAFTFGGNDYSEYDIYEIAEETLYRQLGLNYETDQLKSTKARLADQRSTEVTLEFDDSECELDFPYLDHFPWNDKNFLKPIFTYNWEHTMGSEATPERRQKTCKFLRGGLKFLNAGYGAQDNEINGKPMTPKANDFVHWLRMSEPIETGNHFYDSCLQLRSQAASDPPITIVDELAKTLENPMLKQHALETTNYVSTIFVVPFMEVFLGGVMIQAGIGRALSVALNKPVVDLKQCAKASSYPNYSEVSVEIDQLIVNCLTYFNAAWGLLTPDVGARDFNWMPITENTNQNIPFPHPDRALAWDSPDMLERPGMFYLYATNEWVHFDNVTDKYVQMSPVVNEISRWGLNSEKDYINITGDYDFYKYYVFDKLAWRTSDYFNDMYGWLLLSNALSQSWYLAIQTGGPIDTSVPHFGDRTMIGLEGKIHGGSNEWRPTYPSQMPHAYYSQQIAWNDTTMSEPEQLEIINSMVFMDPEQCKDETNPLYEAPGNLTSIQDFYPFLCKQMKWYGLSAIIGADSKIASQGCRYKLMQTELKKIDYHKALGYTDETAKLRAVLFGLHLHNMDIVVSLTNTVFLITASNIFFVLLVCVLLIYIFIKLILKLINYCGFDMVKLGRMIDDRQYYETNQAKATMKKFWANTNVGSTDHDNYELDLPQKLMRPEGGHFIHTCKILQASAKSMQTNVRLSEERTAPPYMSMNKARGSSEDYQSIGIICGLVGVYWYILFSTGNFK